MQEGTGEKPMINMEWYVFRENTNRKIIEKFNIFDHSGFRKLIEEAVKIATTKEIFADLIKKALMYYFWCKSEHEVVITSWPPYIDKTELDRLNAKYEERYNEWGQYPYCLDVRLTTGEKIDIYSQVMLNWDAFVDYVWEKCETCRIYKEANR